jgi:hypothetical protein
VQCPVEIAPACLCRRFRPSPCLTHYGERWATTPFADFCPFTTRVATRRALRRTVGSGGASSAFALGLSPAPVARDRELRVRWRFRAFRRGPQSDSPLRSTLPFGQISPNKNMNLPCAIAAFTLSTAPGRLRHLVLTRPQTGPSMRFLSVDSQVCARASSGRVLAGAPLPSARGNAFHHRKVRNSHRGLSPHQFMPMSGVHRALEPTAASGLRPLAVPSSLRSSAAAQRQRSAS